VVVGDVVWDVLIRTNTALLTGGDTYGEVELAPGGSAANAAVWARRCGLPTTFVGKVGRDRFGALAEADLRDEGVEAYLVRTDAHLTGTVAVWIDHEGQRSMVSGKGADHALLPQELPRPSSSRPPPAPVGLVVLRRPAAQRGPPRRGARQGRGAPLSLDPGSFQMIEAMGVDAFLAGHRRPRRRRRLPQLRRGAALTGRDDPAEIAERWRAVPGGARRAQARRARRAGARPDGRRPRSRRRATASSTPPAPATPSPAPSSAAGCAAPTPPDAARFAVGCRSG
jgi:ribokinase